MKQAWSSFGKLLGRVIPYAGDELVGYGVLAALGVVALLVIAGLVWGGYQLGQAKPPDDSAERSAYYRGVYDICREYIASTYGSAAPEEEAAKFCNESVGRIAGTGDPYAIESPGYNPP